MEQRKAWSLGQTFRRPWIIGVSVALVIVFGPGWLHGLRLAWRRHVVERKLQRLEAVHQELAQEHERLTSDPVYVEGLIRSTFKVAKPGELVIPLDADEPRSASSRSRSSR
jgi:cell division protein FtsB